MKKYFFGFAAIVLAFAFSAFIKAPKFIDYKFKLKSGVDQTKKSDVENEANWEETALICNGDPQVACTITVDASYTHLEGTAPNQIRVLNTTGSIISIVAVDGYLDESQNPAVRYQMIGTGTNYSHQNTILE
jgi:hypothetical protein